MIRTIILLLLSCQMAWCSDLNIQSSGSLKIAAQQMILDGLKLYPLAESLSELENKISVKKEVPALSLADLIPSPRFEFLDAVSTSVVGIRFTAFIGGRNSINSIIIRYLQEGDKEINLKVHTLESIPKERWTTFIVWLTLPKKETGFHFDLISLDPPSARSDIYISRIERVESLAHSTGPLESAINHYPSLFRKTWSQALILLVVIISLLSILKLAVKQISFLFLGGFLIPPLAATGFLLICAYTPLKNLIHAKIHDVETALSGHFSRVIGLQDKVEQRFQTELAVVTERIRDFLVTRRSAIKSDDPAQSLQLDLEEINDFLAKLEGETGKKLILTDGEYTAHSKDDLEEAKKAHYARAIRKLLFPSYKTTGFANLRQTIQKSRDTILELRKVLPPNQMNKTFLDDFFNNPARLSRLVIRSTPNAWGSFGTHFWSFFNEPQVEILWLMIGSLSRQKLREYYILEYNQTSLFKAIPELAGPAQLDYYLSSCSRGFPPFPEKNTNLGYFDLMSQLAITNQESIIRHRFDGTRFFIYRSGPVEKHRQISLTLRLDATFVIQDLASIENRVYLSTIFILALLSILSLSLAKGVTNPIIAITDGLQKISSGDLRRDLEIPGKDQFAIVARLFNNLIQKLREKEKISKFLSQMALRSLVSTEKTAIRQQATILFCGIINVDNFLEDRDLEYRLAWISKFLNIFEGHLHDSGGFLDKFTGRAALALYLSREDQQHALSCALDLKSDFEKLNEELTAEGLPPFEIGIGIASGIVVLGPIGSAKRRDYTAIGATVNMAARLHYQSYEDKAIRIHIDETSHDLFRGGTGAKFKKISGVKIKGYSESQCIYEVL